MYQSIIGVFCCLWLFFVSLLGASLTCFGSGRSLEIIHQHRRLFFYKKIHRLIAKDSSIETYLLASYISTGLSRLCIGALALYILFVPAYHIHNLLIALPLLILTILLGDLLPYLMVKKMKERAFVFALPLSGTFLTLCFPISFLFIRLSNYALKHIDRTQGYDPIEHFKETLLHILLTANAKTPLSAADTKLIDSIIKFKDKIVREVMVPRIDLFSLPLETPIGKATEHFLEEGYSRIPVYQDSVDNIVGVLMFKDFLRLYQEAFDTKRDPSFLHQPVQTLMKTVLYTPETKKVSQLLQEFRHKQTHLAIVVDEYGGTEGVVTIEDLLEEIVGDIADEYDEDQPVLYTHSASGGWIVDARMNLFDAEEAFHIKIPQEGDYDTIGGYIFHRVGTIPQKGLVIHHNDFSLEILSTTDRHIEKIKIIPRAKI